MCLAVGVGMRHTRRIRRRADCARRPLDGRYVLRSLRPCSVGVTCAEFVPRSSPPHGGSIPLFVLECSSSFGLGLDTARRRILPLLIDHPPSVLHLPTTSVLRSGRRHPRAVYPRGPSIFILDVRLDAMATSSGGWLLLDHEWHFFPHSYGTSFCAALLSGTATRGDRAM